MFSNKIFKFQTTETAEQKSVVNICQDEESSYSSFYSSFLKTDTGSGSNDDSNGTENKNKSDDNVSKCLKQTKFIKNEKY